jgi:hypothetical protein
MNLLEVQEYGSVQAYTISQKTTDPPSNSKTGGHPSRPSGPTDKPGDVGGNVLFRTSGFQKRFEP